MSAQRVDPRFALPAPVGSALVLGGLRPWVDGLESAGVAVTTETAPAGPPPLAVAPVELAGEAVASGAELVVLEGRGGVRPLRRAGFSVQRLIPISSIDSPRHLVRADHRRAAVYAVDHGTVATSRARKARNAVAKTLLARGWLPDAVPAFAVGARSAAPPFFLAEAEALGVPREIEWFLTLGGYDVFSRSVFHVFRRGAREPEWVVKFARVPGYAAPFEHDERGLRLARSAGEEVGRRVPSILGRLEVDGLHASVEEAGVGDVLTDFLERDLSRAAKLEVLEAVAAWIVELGSRSGSASERLTPERARLASEVLPSWAEHGVPASLAERVPPVPGVVQHGNLGAWNVVARDAATFRIIDWESSREVGFPLWDLLVFLTDSLLKLDGALSHEARERHAVRLFRGEVPSSRTLFDWVGRAVRSLELPPEAVGSIATLCWLDQAVEEAARRAEHGSAGEAGARGHAERLARLWVTEAGLGPSWDAWRRP